MLPLYLVHMNNNSEIAYVLELVEIILRHKLFVFEKLHVLCPTICVSAMKHKQGKKTVAKDITLLTKGGVFLFVGLRYIN